MQLMTGVIPSLQALSREGEYGRNKINQYTRYLTVPMALLQAYGFLAAAQLAGRARRPGSTSRTPTTLIQIVTLTAGAIVADVARRAHHREGHRQRHQLHHLRRHRQPRARRRSAASCRRRTSPLIIGCSRSSRSSSVAVIIYIQEGQRRIPIQYASRVRGRRMYQGGQTFLPLRVNQAGVIPIIFAISILLFPTQIALVLHDLRGRDRRERLARRSSTFFSPQRPIYVAAVLPADRRLHVLLHGVHVQTGRDGRAAAQERRLHPRHPAGPADRRTTSPGSSPGSRSPARCSSASSRRCPSVIGAARPVADGPRPRRHRPPDRGQRRRRDDEADRGAAADAQLRRLHPLTPASSRRRRPMTVVVLLGAPGAGKGTQAPILAEQLGVPHARVGRPAPRGRRRAARALGREAERYMNRGQLVPDDDDRPHVPRPPRPARRPARRDPRRLPADAASRPRRSTRRSREAGRRVDRALLHRRADRGRSSRRMANRRICTRERPRLQPASRTRPRSPASATSTARSSSSAPTTRRRPSGPGSPSSCRRSTRSSTTTAPPGILASVDGRQPIDDVTARRHRGRSTRAPERTPDDGHPQVAPRDREDAPGRPDRRRGPRARRGRAQARRHDRPPRPARRAPHPRRRRGPVVQGLRPPQQPVPGQPLHLDRRRGRPRHPRRADDPRGPDRVDRRRRDLRRLARRRRPDLRRRRADARRSRELIDTTRAGDDGRHRRGRARAPTSATSRPRSRTSPRRTATASSASSSATGSAPRCTRSRRSRTTGPASAGMKLAARDLPRDRADADARQPRGRGRARRLDRRHERRLAGRPLRAHDRGHGRTVPRS